MYEKDESSPEKTMPGSIDCKLNIDTEEANKKLDTVISKVKEARAAVKGFNVGHVFDALQGRSTAFAIFFALSITVLAWFGKLTNSYVAAMSVVQALVVGHSFKEDYFSKKTDGA